MVRLDGATPQGQGSSKSPDLMAAVLGFSNDPQGFFWTKMESHWVIHHSSRSMGVSWSIIVFVEVHFAYGHGTHGISMDIEQLEFSM
jgi:hypothetical protein